MAAPEGIVGPDLGRGSEGVRAEGEMLMSVIAAAFAIERAALGAPGRGCRRASLARQVAMYLAHTRLGFSFTEAGALFSRDRTTAAHACRVIEDRREDLSIDGIVDCLERAIDRWLDTHGSRR